MVLVALENVVVIVEELVTPGRVVADVVVGLTVDVEVGVPLEEVAIDVVVVLAEVVDDAVVDDVLVV